MILCCVIFVLLATFQHTQAGDNDPIDYDALFGASPRAGLPFAELAKFDGYPVEEHKLTTSDGYRLTMFRVPLSPSCRSVGANRIPIIFMHGLYLSGDDCIILGPGKAHCYVYSDACYDVWVPNVRGNRYSRNHTTLNPDKDSEFWNFAVDEMALIDLPTFIDYVLEHTGKSQVAYVAHSQGAAMLLMLCAKKPEYNAKIKFGFALSMTAWLEHARFIIISGQAIASRLLDGFNTGTNFEILPHGGLIQKTGNFICGLSELEYPFCSVLIFALLGYNKFQIEDETLRVLTGHVPSGTSMKDFIRWGQMKDNGFAEYDYGFVENIKTYGKTKPPLLDLTEITVPLYIISSLNDYVGDVRDIATLKRHLKTNVSECILPDHTFGHLDFVYGKDVPNYLTPKVLSVLNGGPFVCI